MPELPSGYAGGGLASGQTFSGSNSSGSVEIFAGSTVNTKGLVGVLFASTTQTANWIEINISSANFGMSGLIDIMIGASTEQVIVPDLYVYFHSSGASFPSYLLPVHIPKGSRVTAKWQSTQGSASCFISITLLSGTMLSGGTGPAMVSGYGTTSLSLGVNIDPGATANTWSAWTEITAATTRDHNWLVLAARLGDASVTAIVHYRMQIGIGAATEAVLIPDIPFSIDATTDHCFNPVHAYPIYIPKGSRLTVRARASVTTDGDRDVWVRLYGAG